MTFALSSGSFGSCAKAEAAVNNNAARVIAMRYEFLTGVSFAQQFCGHAETTFPSGNVMTRRSPAREPSLARLASAVTVLLSAVSMSVLLISRARKKLGE